MRFSVIATQQFRGAKLKGVVAADQGEVVGELVAAQDGDVGYEDIRPQIIDEAGNLKSHLSGHVRNHIEAVVIPLYPRLVLHRRCELAVISGGLQIIVIGMDRTSRRKSRQRLHIRRLLEIVAIPVGNRNFVVRVEAMVQTTRRQVFPRVVWKDSTISFKLVYQKPIHRGLAGRDTNGFEPGVGLTDRMP